MYIFEYNKGKDNNPNTVNDKKKIISLNIIKIKTIIRIL